MCPHAPQREMSARAAPNESTVGARSRLPSGRPTRRCGASAAAPQAAHPPRSARPSEPARCVPDWWPSVMAVSLDERRRAPDSRPCARRPTGERRPPCRYGSAMAADPGLERGDGVRQLGLLSVVAPVFDEEETIREFHRRVASALGGTTFELILVDD